MDVQNEGISLLREIRDLLRIMAEPALAERDAKLRTVIREIAGKGVKKQAAILLMTGEMSRPEIIKESSIDAGALSRLIKELSEAEALDTRHENPMLKCPLPVDFFEGDN